VSNHGWQKKRKRNRGLTYIPRFGESANWRARHSGHDCGQGIEIIQAHAFLLQERQIKEKKKEKEKKKTSATCRKYLITAARPFLDESCKISTTTFLVSCGRQGKVKIIILFLKIKIKKNKNRCETEREEETHAVEAVDESNDVRGPVLEVCFVPCLVETLLRLDGPIEVRFNVRDLPRELERVQVDKSDLPQ